MSKSCTMGDLLEAVSKLRGKMIQPQEIMVHPAKLDGVRTALPGEAEETSPIFGIRIHTVDWIEQDEYFMGNAKTIRAILEIAEEYGPEIAKIVLQKILEVSAHVAELESP